MNSDLFGFSKYTKYLQTATVQELKSLLTEYEMFTNVILILQYFLILRPN